MISADDGAVRIYDGTTGGPRADVDALPGPDDTDMRYGTGALAFLPDYPWLGPGLQEACHDSDRFSTMSAAGWRSVGAFVIGGPIQELEASVADAGLSGERFQSDDGGRALLLPVGPLAAGRVAGIAITGASPEATELVLLDAADAADALDLLAALGDRASGVRVALPGDAEPGGLVPDAGRVVITAGAEPPQVYRLVRASDPAQLDPVQSTAPKLGEDPDVLDQRSKWFRSREGPGD